MPNKNYLRGRRLEWQVKKDYELQGYSVMRTAGSHGFADLIAVNNAEIIFIQCKVVKKATPAIRAKLRMEMLKSLPIHSQGDSQLSISNELIIKEQGKSEYEIIYL